MQARQQNSPAWVEEGFAAFETSLNGEASKPRHQVRKQALEQLKSNGFPTTKIEEWKYTNISSLLKTHFELPIEKQDYSSAELDKALSLIPEGPRVVFINGFLSVKHTDFTQLGNGVEVASLKSVFENAGSKLEQLSEKHLGTLATMEGNAFIALNTAFLADGLCVHVSEKTKCPKPLEVLYFSTKEAKPFASHHRLLVVADKEASFEINQRYCGEDSAVYLSSSVSEFVVADNAHVKHHKLQCESLQAFHISNSGVVQGEKSVFEDHSFVFGGQLVRNEICPVILGEHCDTILNGLNVLSGTQQVDNQTIIDHAVPNCESNEWYKSIYDGKSKGNFSGTIIVRQDAQKTNAIQNNQSLLLSGDAESNAKPQLKIWADDVKCTHGATIGQLDEDALFYLRSRGISKDMAHHVLLRAFAGDITTQVENDALREQVEQLLLEKLS